MANITTELEKVIESNEEKITTDSNAKRYIEATKKFEELVEKGVVEKRGYNLLSVEKAHLTTPSFYIL